MLHYDIQAISNEFPGLSLEDIQEVQHRIENNQHKLKFPPVCKISK